MSMTEIELVYIAELAWQRMDDGVGHHGEQWRLGGRTAINFMMDKLGRHIAAGQQDAGDFEQPTGEMTPERAAYFMRRFKREEKLLGPNEQAAVDYVLNMLATPQPPKPAGCGACGDDCKDRGACRLADESPKPAGAVPLPKGRYFPNYGYLHEDVVTYGDARGAAALAKSSCCNICNTCGDGAGRADAVLAQLSETLSDAEHDGALAERAEQMTTQGEAVKCNAPKDGRLCYPECGCDSAEDCAYPPPHRIAAMTPDDITRLADRMDQRTEDSSSAKDAIALQEFAAELRTLAQQGKAGGVPEKYDGVLLPFVALMRAELHANSGKGDRPGWLRMSTDTCLLETYYHLAKLQKAVRKDAGNAICEHAADVANMVMMLVDICGGLGQVCSYPQCNCPFDAPGDPNWCARGFPTLAPQPKDAT